MKPSEIPAVLDMARRARANGFKFNPLFSGAPGLGKSEIVQQYANKNGLPFIDLRIAYMEAPDMIGFPQPQIVNGKQTTVHFLPEIWPDAELQPEGILLLEEVNRGTQSMMNTLMQLLTDRKVHKYVLPPGWIIVSCINPETSANDVNSMDTALRDRFEIFEIEYDKKTFVGHMNDDKWDTSIVQFVESNAWVFRSPEDIGNVEGAKYASPRTFSKLNAVRKSVVPKEMEYEVYTSILGKLTGKAYYAFVTNEAPITYNDLIEKKEASLRKLKVYSDPENYKSGLISVTVRSILENAKELDVAMLYDVAMTIPADQGLHLIREVEYRRNEENILENLCKKHKDMKVYFKAVLKDEGSTSKA